MTLSEFVKKSSKGDTWIVRPKIICKDGFTMSVQGSSGHYCSPRKNNAEYSQMEIGYPSHEEPLIVQYVEDEDNLTGTAYGYVPCSVIEQVIEKHGGIDTEKQTF